MWQMEPNGSKASSEVVVLREVLLVSPSNKMLSAIKIASDCSVSSGNIGNTGHSFHLLGIVVARKKSLLVFKGLFICRVKLNYFHLCCRG